MGQRQETFEKILKTVTEIRSVDEIRRPKLEDIVSSSGLHQQVLAVYRELGGCLDEVPARVEPWDTNVSGIAVELDEDLHFNRYRSITLDSPLYAELANFPLGVYQTYCADYEEQCLKAGHYGGKWTNASCEKQFGKSSPPGKLSIGGASRWKQRAFYDFIKDLAPLTIEIRMARISIWDHVIVDEKSVPLLKILKQGMHSAAGPLFTLIQQRSCKPRRYAVC